MRVQVCAFKGSASLSPLAYVMCFKIRKQLLEQFVVICQLDKIINKVNNISEPVEIKLSNQNCQPVILSFTAKLLMAN